MRRFLLPLFALVFAAAATFLARDWLDRRDRSPAQPTEAARPVVKSVLVAAKRMGVGQLVQPDDVRWQEWPDVKLPDGYLVEGRRGIDDVAGAVARRPVAEGEPITEGSVVKPGDRGFLAAVLDPGMRAVSVPVDEASANAGLIFPGDRVDLVLTQTLGGGEGGGEQHRVSETVIEDVRVIAMGRRLKPEEGDDGGGGGGGQPKTVTLEVTPARAEKVALMTELGKLALSLRSLAVDGTGIQPTRPATGATWDTDVSPMLRPENQPRTTMSVVRGQEAQTVTIRRGATP